MRGNPARRPRTRTLLAAATAGTALLGGFALATSAAVAVPAAVAASRPFSAGVQCKGAANPLAGSKLTLPVSDSGGTGGNGAKEISPATLYPPYLTKGAGGLDFFAPTHGATTTNSLHTRSELVSLTNWSMGRGTHTLCATAKVVQTPAESHDVIVGQIHAAGDYSALPFVMLHYDNGEIRVSVVNSTADKEQVTVYPLLGGVPLNAVFSYRLTDNGNGTMTFTAGYGTKSAVKQVKVPASFRGLPVRFSAGAYNQDPATDTTSGSAARVDFAALSGLAG